MTAVRDGSGNFSGANINIVESPKSGIPGASVATKSQAGTTVANNSTR